MNQTTAAVTLLFATLLFAHASPVAAVTATTTTSTTASLATTTATTSLPLVSVETRVREYFVDIPVMVEIARCESKFRQFTDSGSVLRGGSGGGMIGVFQFYERIHAKAALALGFDLATLEGNLAYARNQYIGSGTTPWNSASSCWSTPAVVSAQNSTSNLDPTIQLHLELLTKLIGLLQQLLVMKLAGE